MAEGYQGQELANSYGYAAFIDGFGPNITSNESQWNQSYVVFGHAGQDYATDGLNDFFTDGKFSIAMMLGPGAYDYSSSVNLGSKTTRPVNVTAFLIHWKKFRQPCFYLSGRSSKSFMYEICHEGEEFSLNSTTSTLMFCGPDDPGCRKSYDWFLSQDGSSILECLADAGGVQETSALFLDSDMTCQSSLETSSVYISREATTDTGDKNNEKDVGGQADQNNNEASSSANIPLNHFSKCVGALTMIPFLAIALPWFLKT